MGVLDAPKVKCLSYHTTGVTTEDKGYENLWEELCVFLEIPGRETTSGIPVNGQVNYDGPVPVVMVRVKCLLYWPESFDPGFEDRWVRFVVPAKLFFRHVEGDVVRRA